MQLRRTILTWLTATLMLAVFAPGAQAKSDLTAADAALLKMAGAFKSGNQAQLRALLPQVKGHLLEPWAAYWELRARLDGASADEVNAFFQRWQGTYQEDRLRNDWLLLLGRRRDWGLFAQSVFAFRMNDDIEVRCYTMAMESILARANFASEVQKQWLLSKGVSDACNLAAQSHYQLGWLPEEDIWQKARQLVQARQLTAARLVLAIISPTVSAQAESALAEPKTFLLHNQGQNASPQLKELALLALTRWADSDPDGAAAALQQSWSPSFSPAQLSWLWGVIGRQAAIKLSDRALVYFGHASAEGMLDEHLVWRARAALRQHQWSEVLAAVAAMSPMLADSDSWMYWRARALLESDASPIGQAKARALLQSIAGIGSFYALLAQEELGQPISTTGLSEPAPSSAEEKRRINSNPGLQRALAALALGLYSQGVREWNYSTNLHTPGGMSERDLLAAADLACRRAIWDRCINTSERSSGSFNLKQRFPLPYRKAVVRHSQSLHLDPAYVYGLMRQESRFVADIRSSAGALGLMQVMPATASWTAKKIGLSNFNGRQLKDFDTNIVIGTNYLKMVLDDFSGSMPFATAAYNAGPRRSRSWRELSGARSIEAAIWIENIPFTETRDYVKKVLANTTVYAAILERQPQSLKARLGLVEPPSSNDPVGRDLP